MCRIATVFAAFVFAMNLAVGAAAHTIITRMADKGNVTLSQLAAAAGGSDVIFVGETHTDKNHHELQLDLIRLLFADHLQLAIGLEMIEATYQPQLDEWISGSLPEAVMKDLFERNWSEWALYRGIFLFARENRIPMLALNVPAPIIKKIAEHGFDSLTAQEKRGLPEGTSCDYRNPQVVMLKNVFRLHGSMMEGKDFKNFCEAQTVRNSGMASRIADYLNRHPGSKVVTLTGIWHAEKHAIPEHLQRGDKKPSYTVILPETKELSIENSSSSEADYLIGL